jgi:hypothetical protein
MAPGMPFGTTAGAPLAAMRVLDGAMTDLPGQRIWSATVAAPDGPQEHEMRRAADGRLELRIAGRHMLQVAADRDEAILGDVSEAVGWQLLTTFALPMAAQRAGALMLHAAVVVRAGAALVVCAQSGTGKSSLLIALTDAGWEALSEDMVAVTFEDDAVMAWPGPPWVRISPGEPGPDGAAVRFVTTDKVGWDLSSRMCARPVPVARLVLLDPPTDQPADTALATSEEVMGALAHHTPWFEEPARRGAALWGSAVRFARAVPAMRVRLQRRDEWRREAVSVFDVVATT